VFFDLRIAHQTLGMSLCLGCLLVFGWAVGLLANGLVLRFGLGAEEIGWAVVFLIGPLSGAYYPISVLPIWLQHIAYSMPTAWAFEAMRSGLIEGRIAWNLLGIAMLLNWLYFCACAFLFYRLVESGRERGLLLQMGE